MLQDRHLDTIFAVLPHFFEWLGRQIAEGKIVRPAAAAALFFAAEELNFADCPACLELDKRFGTIFAVAVCYNLMHDCTIA